MTPTHKMKRGDSLVFTRQVVRDAITNVLSTVAIGDPIPPGCVPQDITGYFFWFTAKFNTQDPDIRAVSQLTTTGGGVTLPNPGYGYLMVNMPPVATRGFPDGPVDLFFDIQAKPPSGIISTVDDGSIRVTPDVTNAIA